MGIAAYIGWKSERIMLIEPGLGAILYTILLILLFPGWPQYEGYKIYFVYRIALCVWAFTIAFTGSSIGRLMQRQEMNGGGG